MSFSRLIILHNLSYVIENQQEIIEKLLEKADEYLNVLSLYFDLNLTVYNKVFLNRFLDDFIARLESIAEKISFLDQEERDVVCSSLLLVGEAYLEKAEKKSNDRFEGPSAMNWMIEGRVSSTTTFFFKKEYALSIGSVRKPWYFFILEEKEADIFEELTCTLDRQEVAELVDSIHVPVDLKKMLFEDKKYPFKWWRLIPSSHASSLHSKKVSLEVIKQKSRQVKIDLQEQETRDKIFSLI